MRMGGNARWERSVRGTRPDFLHEDSHANRCGLYYLHQWIWHIHVRREDRAASRAGSVERVGGCRIYFLHVVPGTRDGNPGRIDVDLGDLLASGEVARHSRMNLNVSRQPRVERQMQLAGNNLHHVHVRGMTHLLRSEIKGAFSSLGVAEIDFRVDLAGLQLTDHTLRSPHADLRLGNRLGTDFKMLWNMLKDDGRVKGHFCRLLVGGNLPPQPCGQ